MANDLLISAIRTAGLDRDQLADQVGVDRKTVDRWITGRVPQPRYRTTVARVTGIAEDQIWPEMDVRRGAGESEVAGSWPRRDLPDVPDWRALLREAEHHVDLLGWSLGSVLRARGAIDALTAKAAGGVPVRICVVEPTCEAVYKQDRASKQPTLLIQRIDQIHLKLRQLAGVPGVSVRVHAAGTSHTILRFDDQLLLTVHLHATPGFQAPVLHLRRRQDYGVFDQLTGHLQDVWSGAQEMFKQPEPEPTKAPEAPKPARSGADVILDQLEQTWRPGH